MTNTTIERKPTNENHKCKYLFIFLTKHILNFKISPFYGEHRFTMKSALQFSFLKEKQLYLFLHLLSNFLKSLWTLCLERITLSLQVSVRTFQKCYGPPNQKRPVKPFKCSGAPAKLAAAPFPTLSRKMVWWDMQIKCFV